MSPEPAQPSFPPAPDEFDAGWSLVDDEPRPERDSRWIGDRWGSRVLAWVGGVVTVLGIVLLLVLAVQRGWLAPGPRLLCGAVLGAVLLAASGRVHRTAGGQLGAFAVAATGFTALYLDAVAATVLYHVLPTLAGLLVALAVAGGGLFLADRWRSPALAMFVVLAAAGAAPLVTQAVTPLLVAFLLVLAAAAAPVQLHRNWPYLAIAAEGPPLVFGLVLDRIAAQTGADVPATVGVAWVTLVLCVLLALVRSDDDPVASGLLAVSPVQVMAAAPLLPTWPAVGSLAAASALLFGVWAGLRGTRKAMVAGGAGAVTLCQATFLATSADTATLSITLLCQAILFAVAARQVAGRGTVLVALCYAGAGLVAGVTGPLRPALLVIAPVGRVPQATLVSAGVVAVLVLGTAGAVGWAMLRMPVRGLWPVIAVVALYGFSGAMITAVMLVSPDAAAFHVGHLLTTVGWTIGALVLLIKGINALPVRIAGLTLVGAAVVKLFTFDLVQLDGIVRAAAFLGTGVVLLVAGVRYAKLVSTVRDDDVGDLPG